MWCMVTNQEASQCFLTAVVMTFLVSNYLCYMMCLLTILTYVRMLGKLCTWAESTWPTVGRVDRRGHPKRTICDACGPCQRNRSILRLVFRWFWPIHCAYVSFRCLNLLKWRFSCRRRRRWQRQMYKPITLPLAYARGVITLCVHWG